MELLPVIVCYLYLTPVWQLQDLRGERLGFQLLRGAGPLEGYVSLRIKGKDRQEKTHPDLDPEFLGHVFAGDVLDPLGFFVPFFGISRHLYLDFPYLLFYSHMLCGLAVLCPTSCHLSVLTSGCGAPQELVERCEKLDPPETHVPQVSMEVPSCDKLIWSDLHIFHWTAKTFKDIQLKY